MVSADAVAHENSGKSAKLYHSTRTGIIPAQKTTKSHSLTQEVSAMGLLLDGDGLWTRQGGWVPADFPLFHANLAADGGRTAVDNAAHLVYHAGRVFPCDRDIEALALWQGHALLLSSDTDCLSLWDGEGAVRTARVGVYPQDMAVRGDTVWVCGGADGRVHGLALPELHSLVSYPLPGMPERIAFRGETAYILSLLAEEDVRTALFFLDLQNGHCRERARWPGLPGALAADDGLWVGVSEQVLHLTREGETDLRVEGFGLPRRICVQGELALVTDPVAGADILVRRGLQPMVQVLRQVDNPDLFLS